MRKAGDPAILLFGLAAGFVWRSGCLPPHGGETFPSAGLERLLRHPVARIGAAAALAAVAEVRIPIFLVEVRIENIERGLAGVVLANPKIPVRLDIEEELAGQTPPVVDFALVVVLAAFRINAWVDQRRRFHASKEFRIHFLLRRDTKFPFADDNGVQPKSGIAEFPRAIVHDVFHLIDVLLGDGDIQNQFLAPGQLIVEISDRLQNFWPDVGVGQLVAANAIQRDGNLRNAAGE